MLSSWPDKLNNRTVKLDANGTLLDVFTTSSPALYRPSDVVVDAAGSIYITDSGNSRIVKLSSTGAQLAVYGTALNHPRGLSLDSAGGVYVVDSSNNRVVKFDVHAMQQSRTFTPVTAALPAAGSLAVDLAGNWYTFESYQTPRRQPRDTSHQSECDGRGDDPATRGAARRPASGWTAPA